MKVDLHIHTCYSKDSLTSLEAVIETCQRRGLDKVAITDHNTITGALALREIAPELVVVGEEIKTPAGELIAYFLEEKIPKGLSPEETIARIRAQGGVVGIPHPLDRLRREAMRWANLMEIIDQIDVLEVFNARAIFPADNRRAEQLAHQRSLLVTAGSDAHAACEIGQAYLEMPPFDGKEEFMQSLAQGQIVGRLSAPWIHFSSTYAKLWKSLFAWP